MVLLLHFRERLISWRDWRGWGGWATQPSPQGSVYATFDFAYSLEMHNDISSLNPLYTAQNAQFYSPFSRTAISLTPRFRGKCEVWLHFFAENAKFDSAFLPKTIKTIQNHTVAKTMLNFISCFWRIHSVMLRAFSENGEWLKILNI
jgi:hypothetical protein